MFSPEKLPDNISVMIRKIMDSENPGAIRCHRLAGKAAANGETWEELRWLAGAVSCVYPYLDGPTLGYVTTELALHLERIENCVPRSARKGA